MKSKLFSSKKGVSTIVAIMTMIALIFAATAAISYLFLNIEVIDLTQNDEEQQTKIISLIFSIEAVTGESEMYYDKIEFTLSLNESSPNIVIYDVDILLPTGVILDEQTSWTITGSSIEWNNEKNGYLLISGTENQNFTAECSNQITNTGKISEGQAFYVLIKYYYSTINFGTEKITSGIFQSALIKPWEMP